MTEGWKYGNIVPPVVSSLEGREPALPNQARDRVFWLLRRYTSLFYIARQQFLLSKLIEGLRGEASRQSDPFVIRWFMDILGPLYQHLGEYEKGVALLRRGEKRGYLSIGEAAKASEYLSSRIFYDEGGEYSWLALGNPAERPLVGILAWGRRAYTMMQYTLMTLRAEWTYERFQEPPFAEPDGVYPSPLAPAPFPAPGALLRAAGAKIPIGGIWWPIDRRLGCPNYLLEHQEAPDAMSTVEWLDYPAMPGSSRYVYERRPSRWELAWVEQRYLGGIIPNEEEFDSADIQPPAEPLRLLPFR